MVEESRRSFLSKTGAALSCIALGTTSVTATPTNDQYIVDLKSTSKSELGNVEVVHMLDEIDIAVVRGTEESVPGKYAQDIEFERTKPPVSEADVVKDYSNPRYDLQWDKQTNRIPNVHGVTRGEGTLVGVIDSGVWGNHPDLEHAINEEKSWNLTLDNGDYNPNGTGDHGTHVAGIIAADDQNGSGVVGVAPGAEIASYRVFSRGGGATFGNILGAIVLSAAQGCDVANLSLGAYIERNIFVEFLILALERAARYAERNGTLLVAAAGNNGVNLNRDEDMISLPNEAKGFMSVSSTGPIGYRWDDEGCKEEGWGDRCDMEDALENLWRPTHEPAPYTNHGSKAVDISAPGGNYDVYATNSEKEWYYDLVLSTVFTRDRNGRKPGYGWKAGTSMAAPQVAATAALVKSRHQTAEPGEVRTHLEKTAEDLGSPTYHGEGHLDIESAVWKQMK